MTLNLTLPPDLEARLTEEALRQGVSPSHCTLQLLSKHLPAPGRQKQLVSLLQSWMDNEDDAEQKETGDYLVRALDEDRPSDRKLFPAEMKGVTW